MPFHNSAYDYFTIALYVYISVVLLTTMQSVLNVNDERIILSKSLFGILHFKKTIMYRDIESVFFVKNVFFKYVNIKVRSKFLPKIYPLSFYSNEYQLIRFIISKVDLDIVEIEVTNHLNKSSM